MVRIQVPTIIFDTISLVGCCWLLWKIRGRDWLLPRQIWHLALADLLLSSGELISELIVYLGSNLGPVAACVFSCSTNLGVWASILWELHIAAGFSAAFWRWRGVLSFLEHSLWLPWVLAGVFSSLMKVFLPLASVDDHTIAKLWGGLTLILFGTTCVLYGIAAWRAYGYTARQQQRATKMLWMYLFCFVLTLGPLALGLLSGTNFNSHRDTVAGLFVALNGTCNLLCYACQSSQKNPQLLQGNGSIARGSMTKDFDHWAGRSSMPVGFGQCEVVLVDNLQDLSMEGTEHEAAQANASSMDIEDSQGTNAESFHFP